MTIHHHLEHDLLLSYAAGSLAESWSLAIAAHLSHCPACRRNLELAEIVGGALLQGIAEEKMAAGALNDVLAEIGETGQESLSAATAPSEPVPVLPKPVRDYIGGEIDDLPWQRLGRNASQYLIETADDEAQVRLLRIKAGKPVPCHGHGGRELTLVLSGRFADELLEFGPGDIEDLGEETVHKPVAGGEEDCICLAVTDAPLKFMEFIPRILQPFLKI